MKRVFQSHISYTGGNSLVTLALMDTTGVKWAAIEAIPGVNVILVAATILFTVGGVRSIPRLRVERTISSLPGRAVPGQDRTYALKKFCEIWISFKQNKNMFNPIQNMKRYCGRRDIRKACIPPSAWRRIVLCCRITGDSTQSSIISSGKELLDKVR